MKTPIRIFLNVITTLSIVTLLGEGIGPDNNSAILKMRNDEMLVVVGQGCTFWGWWDAVLAFPGCSNSPDPYACMQSAGVPTSCIDILYSAANSPVNSGSSSATPAAPDPILAQKDIKELVDNRTDMATGLATDADSCKNLINFIFSLT
jgi:hypothetical protein